MPKLNFEQIIDRCLQLALNSLFLIDGQMDMHMLTKQRGTSIAMLEQDDSKMTATMAAERLA